MPHRTRRTGILFDVDGTLVDTNYFHVLAWWRAFQEHGVQISMAALHDLIGMGAKQAIERVTGASDDAIREAHSRHYAEFRGEVRAFPGARELVRTVHERGALAILATGAEKDDLDAILRALDLGDALDALVSDADVERSKPAPDIFNEALRRGALEPADAMVVGDSVWDCSAALAAGLRCVAVRSGGVGMEELRAAGAITVYPGVKELLENLDESPLRSLLPR